MVKIISSLIIWFEKHYIISLLITILIAIFIFYMSSIPFQTPPGPKIPYKSYMYHAGIFFIFAFFLSISFIKGNHKNKIFIILAMLIAIAYGISDELHQSFVPYRVCAFDDAIANSFGILFAGVFYFSNFMWRNRKIIF